MDTDLVFPELPLRPLPDPPLPPLFAPRDEEPNHGPPKPLSPWAQRFGIDDAGHDPVFTRASQRKSGLAPERYAFRAFRRRPPTWLGELCLEDDQVNYADNLSLASPSIHPKYYGDPFQVEHQGIFLTSEDIDRFYCADWNFKNHFRQIAPWQLGPVNLSLCFSQQCFVPGGHIRSLAQVVGPEAQRTILDTEALQVNEDNWYLFLKKDRWWGSSASPGDPLTVQQWSVDDSAVWSVLRLSIELADRILTALVTEKHPFLETLLFGKITYWNNPEYQEAAPIPEPQPQAKVLLSREFIKQRWQAANGNAPFAYDVLDTYDEFAWEERLEELASHQQWALLPPDDDQAGNQGTTDASMDGIIVLNTARLKTCLSTEPTFAERCSLIVTMADTIVHEFAHGLVYQRISRDTNPLFTDLLPYSPDWMQFPEMNSEPFVDYGFQSEMGYALEAAIFGGAIRTIAMRGEHVSMVGLYKRSWPFAGYQGVGSLGNVAKSHPACQDGMEDTMTLLSSLWTSGMLSEEFWSNGAIPRKSDGFFQSIDCFRSEHPYVAATHSYMSRPEPTLMDREQLKGLNDQGQLRDGLMDMITEWELRESLFNQARVGWYFQKHFDWLNSPWSAVEARKKLCSFNEEIRKPALDRQLSSCANNAEWLVSTITWGSDQDLYIDALQKGDKIWPWHAIGLLMMAAIPLRQFEQTNLSEMKSEDITLYPSADNAAQATSTKVFTRYKGKDKDSWPRIPPSKFFDPFDRNGQEIPFGSYNHFDYLDHVKKVIRFFNECQMAVSKPWVNEILRIEARIRAQREQMQDFGMSSEIMAQTYAADAWALKIPVYDETEHFWDDRVKGWAEVSS
ncbi:hypothetical protein F5Y08DRAFT_339246 [Xylaria arbuscula]|nr:hypothetical protein F5Y08DRAFT_339246 [Xylaria arbuscula]